MEFVEALDRRIEELAAACTQCGKCFEACPMTRPLGIAGAEPTQVLGGIVDLLKGGAGNEEARRWAGGCSSSGLCLDACDYGVDARVLVRMANYANRRRVDGPAVRQKALTSFRNMAKTLRVVSRLQLDGAALARLQSQPDSPATHGRLTDQRPDVALYTGCNVAKTPHILVLVLEVLGAIGATYELVGGPTACCGINQFRAGDGETSGRAGLSTLGQIKTRNAAVNVSWCPSCQSQFDEVIAPNHELMTGERFELAPFFTFLEGRLDRLAPLFVHRVEKRVALNERPGYPDVVRAVERILARIPGIEIVRLDVPRAGLMANYLTVTPTFKEGLRRVEFEAAAAAGVTTLATIFHACHREQCHLESGASFEIVNVMEIIGQAMGLYAEDIYKRLKLMPSVEEMMAACAPLIAEHGLDPDEAREILIADQLALKPVQGEVLERVPET